MGWIENKKNAEELYEERVHKFKEGNQRNANQNEMASPYAKPVLLNDDPRYQQLRAFSEKKL